MNSILIFLNLQETLTTERKRIKLIFSPTLSLFGSKTDHDRLKEKINETIREKEMLENHIKAIEAIDIHKPAFENKINRKVKELCYKYQIFIPYRTFLRRHLLALVFGWRRNNSWYKKGSK